MSSPVAGPATAARATPPGEVGCVLACDTGVVEVLTDAGRLRASYGGRLLGRIARDRACVPEPGEWVRLRHWGDGPVTVEEVLGFRAGPAPAVVLPLRRRAGAAPTRLRGRP